MKRLPFLLLIFLTLYSPAVHATQVLRLSLADLTHRADAIVVGHVVSQSVHWNDTGQRIYTDTVVAVDQDLRDRLLPTSTVVVRQAGGMVGNVGMVIAGVPKFASGETVLLFLRRAGQFYGVVGLAQGKMKIVKTAKAELLVLGESADMGLLAPNA